MTSYNHTSHKILTKEISLILPNFPKNGKDKRGIISSLITGFIHLAYDGISSYLHNKRQKALHKAFMGMEIKINLQCNNICHLEDSMVMYGIYNADTLEDLINSVYKMHNQMTWNENLSAGKFHQWNNWYLTRDAITQYVINSLLYLRMLKEEYVKMYERFISQLQTYAKA